jgi:hypothetical protein
MPVFKYQPKLGHLKETSEDRQLPGFFREKGLPGFLMD